MTKKSIKGNEEPNKPEMSEEELEREQERQSELKMLKCSWDMYEKTKAETLERRTNATDKNGNKIYSEASTRKTMKLLETMQEDIKEKYLALGGTIEELTAKPKKGRKGNSSDNSDRMKKFKAILEKEKRLIDEGVIKEDDEAQEEANSPIFIPEEDEEPVSAYTIPASETNRVTSDGTFVPNPTPDYPELSEESEEENMRVSVDVTKAKGNNIKYDMISLPSKGQCYKGKIAKIPVGYLTAYDENMIVSPNMYKDGSFLDYIVKAKVMTDAIDTEDLLPGDRDAIILWLRASGYGPEFPVNAVDSATGQQFDSVVDLTKLEYKKFTLKGDSNGYFDYELPVSHDKIKFKFLSVGDMKKLEDMEKDEVVSLRKAKANDVADMIEDFLENDGDIKIEMKTKLSDAVKAVREYSDSIEGEDNLIYSHTVTNKLAMSIMSVNGVTDRKYIDEYVMYMNVRDSSSLRKYIVENEPGIDFNVEVERPKSLGGGSVRMFLTIDQFIFLTLT